MNLFCFFRVSAHLKRDFIKVFSQICNERLHPPQEGSSPLEVGGAALLRLYPSYSGWGPNSLQVLTKTPFIIVYQAYYYTDIISCKALQWTGVDAGDVYASRNNFPFQGKGASSPPWSKVWDGCPHLGGKLCF